MGIQFITGGFLTTVQDMGRTGYQEFGMSVSGVMDPRSAALANLLVGNEETEGVLEITLMGPMMEIEEENILAITGADLGAKLNGSAFPMYQAVPVHKGDKISFTGMFGGSRAYVAVAGGFDVPLVMGSKSTNLKSKVGGLEGRKIGSGDKLSFAAPKTTLPNLRMRRVAPETDTTGEKEIRVILGPQDDCFTEAGVTTFLNEIYTFTNESDRMGCRLEGTVIEHKDGGDIITDGIAFGAIQVPSHGQPIIMMADHQTTGGYTKIANVISVDLPLVAQSRPGDQVHFRAVTVEEAQTLYVEWKKQLAAWKEEWNREPVLTKELEAAIQTAVAYEANKYWKKAGTYRVTVEGSEFLVELQEESEGLR